MKYLFAFIFLISGAALAEDSFCQSKAGQHATWRITGAFTAEADDKAFNDVKFILVDKCIELEKKKTPVGTLVKELEDVCAKAVQDKFKGKSMAKYYANCRNVGIAGDSYAEGMERGAKSCAGTAAAAGGGEKDGKGKDEKPPLK